MIPQSVSLSGVIELTREELAATIGGDAADATLGGALAGGAVGVIWATQTAQTVATITVGAALGPVAIGIIAGAALGYAAWYFFG